MLQLKNATPLKATFTKFPNLAGVDTLYVVVTATFNLSPHLELAEEQLEPVLSDTYERDPGTSSLRYPSELNLGKPSTDILLVGHARAPGGKPTPQLGVGIRVGPYEKLIEVFGDRSWRGLEPTKPVPFTEMPLIYERAFGGCMRADDSVIASEERNPVGVGLAIGKAGASYGDPLPNIEDPRQLLCEGTCPTPTGLGAIAPSWLPRRSLVGTYDERWQKTRAPYLPEDFDPRFFNTASEGLILPKHLQGGEPLVLLGVSERGPLHTAIPTCAIEVAFALRGQLHATPVHLQTVLVEPDDNRLRLTYHSQFVCDKLALEIERIEIRLQRIDLPVSR